MPGYLTVSEAAKQLGVSSRSLYGYIAQGDLAVERIGQVIVVPQEAISTYTHRRVVGRPRTRTPPWRLPVVMNLQYLVHMTVQIRPGMGDALEQWLVEIRASQKHQMPGTVARYIVRNAEEVQIVLIWRHLSMPPEHEVQAALDALRTDLAALLDWEHSCSRQGSVILNT